VYPNNARREEMIEKGTWTPRPSDIEWAKNFVLILRDGGVWGNSFGVYKINHKKKVLKLIGIFDERFRESIHDRSVKVFAELGWKITDNTKKGKEAT
jgi:hypothetical protein